MGVRFPTIKFPHLSPSFPPPLTHSIQVMEPPLRNSGFTGGTFLSRRTIKKLDGTTLTYEDLYVGCRLRILMHEFKLLSTSDGTLRWMEDKVG